MFYSPVSHFLARSIIFTEIPPLKRENSLPTPFIAPGNRRSSEIQGTALGKSLRAWTCIYRSRPEGVAQSRHAFVGGTVSTWAR